MKILFAIAAWFTADRRQLIQLFFGSLAPIAIAIGYVTQEQSEQWLIVTGASLQFAASLLSLVNLRGGLNVWTVLRGAIYTFGFTIAPALTVLGFVDEATSAAALQFVSLGLSSLSGLVAILVGKQQQYELAA